MGCNYLRVCFDPDCYNGRTLLTLDDRAIAALMLSSIAFSSVLTRRCFLHFLMT